jgi:hypothetical protein
MVWDIERGYLLKLGEDRKILSATHGFENVTKDEIL